MSRQVLCLVIPTKSFVAEGRRFYEGESYPVLKKDDNYVTLCAENGEFNFSNQLMDQAIQDWDLKVTKEGVIQ